MVYDKPYKTTKELIEILGDRNLQFNNEKVATDLLNTVGYYDLINAYKKCFYKNSNSEEYKDGLSFEYLYAFYYVDKEFQNIMLNAILLVENIFKNRISQVISCKYGVHESQYLNSKIFQNKSYRINGKKTHSNEFIKNIHNDKINISNPCDAMKHYKDKHNHIPAWILFKDFTFMETLNFYRFLNKTDQQEIADLMISSNIPISHKVQYLKKILQFLRKNRNVIAHNNLFIGNNISSEISNAELNSMLPSVLKNTSSHQKNAYTLICFILILLNVNILKRFFISRIMRMNIYNKLMYSSNGNILTLYYEYLELPKDFNIIIDNYFNTINNKSESRLIKGNKKRKIYHLQDGAYYSQLSSDNVIFFKDEKEAISYGYRKSKR